MNWPVLLWAVLLTQAVAYLAHRRHEAEVARARKLSHYQRQDRWF